MLILADGIKEIVKALRGARAYFMRFWNWVEIAFLSFSSATIAVVLYTYTSRWLITSNIDRRKVFLLPTKGHLGKYFGSFIPLFVPVNLIGHST